MSRGLAVKLGVILSVSEGSGRAGREKREDGVGHNRLIRRFCLSSALAPLPSPFAPLPSPLFRHRPHHFPGLRKSARLMLRKDPLPVHGDVEYASASPLEFRVDSEGFLDLGRQTGGPGGVVSNDAVFNLDVHDFSSYS